MLRNERCYVLKHRLTQTSLNEESMIHTAMSLNHAQVINPSVAVEIKVVNHIPAGVEYLLELRYITRLGESRSDSIEVEIEREISIEIRYRHGGDRRVLWGRRGYRGRINRLGWCHRFYRWCYRENTGPATRETYRR